MNSPTVARWLPVNTRKPPGFGLCRDDYIAGGARGTYDGGRLPFLSKVTGRRRTFNEVNVESRWQCS
ncbi:hypothetical protein QFZ70_000812 [Arthrobacter sp. V1I9]|nr:hypothetical protein [Arthrobacter sp. V1I9]